MITHNNNTPMRIALVVLAIALVGVVCFPVQALPVTGAAVGITSNNVTIPVTGASGSVMVQYGQVSGHPIWWSDNVTAVGGSATITIWGSPLIGGAKYYASACDDTGCGNEISYTMASITPVPTRHYDVPFNNIVATHWSITSLAFYMFAGYTTNIPMTLVFGIIIGSIVIGFWRRTRSVRLIGILMLIISPLIASPQTGLYLGIPLVMQSLGMVLFAFGLAGIFLSFIKK